MLSSRNAAKTLKEHQIWYHCYYKPYNEVITTKRYHNMKEISELNILITNIKMILSREMIE